MIEVTDEINAIAADLLQRYKDEIKNSGHSASGDLVNTASYRCTFDGRYFEIIFRLADYWKYLENGTKPHFPPLEAIEKWITVKHIVPRTNSKRVPTTRQLAYLIARGISNNGTKPTKLLQKTIDNSNDLIDALVNVITKQIEEEINSEIENTIEA